MTDITELAQRMRTAAGKATPGKWCAYTNAKTGTFAIHTPDDSRHGNIIDWMGFDGVDMSNAQKSRNAKFIALANPANILALVDTLEQAQQHETQASEMAVQLSSRLTTANKRIAELESRTVTIEPFRSFVTDADLAALHRFAECCDDPESGGHDLEKEQVRRLEAIGALQRSGRISYITGFGDVLISIAAGIKGVE